MKPVFVSKADAVILIAAIGLGFSWAGQPRNCSRKGALHVLVLDIPCLFPCQPECGSSVFQEQIEREEEEARRKKEIRQLERKVCLSKPIVSMCRATEIVDPFEG